MDQHTAYIRRLVEQGGPRETDYAEFDAWITCIYNLVQNGQMSCEELAAVRDAFGEVLSPATLPGFVFSKPHGYAGDYEIIDLIYLNHISSDPRFRAWDLHGQARSATQAVRNRKTYFHELLDRHQARSSTLRVLKIASGPGRSMFEWLNANPTATISFTCVEIDPEAIQYASALNRSHLDKITFVQKNALRYCASGKHDLIWAAGIFDYFNDRAFVSLLRRLLPALDAGGELVIGNFADGNPGRPYMELFDWMLYHRSPADLTRLAIECGVPQERIRIGSEPERINLFLHISKGPDPAG